MTGFLAGMCTGFALAVTLVPLLLVFLLWLAAQHQGRKADKATEQRLNTYPREEIQA